MKKTRIIIADDHSLMRFGLKTLFNHQPDMCVVGEATDGQSAIDLAEQLRPDVIVMDLMMPVVDGATATQRIKDLRPETQVIILTSYGTSEDLVRAISNGASGARIKSEPIEDIVDAVRLVSLGRESFSDSVRRFIRETPRTSDLTDRQLEILAAAAKGFSNNEIADRLKISPSGVNKHLLSIYQKLGVSSRAEAVALSLSRQILKSH